MKRTPKYTQPNREDLYTPEQIQFVKEFYGKLKPLDIAQIIGRTRNGVYNIARRYFFKAHASLYGMVKVSYQGKEYEVMTKRYKTIKTATGYEKIDMLKGTKIIRKSRAIPKPIEKKPMAAHRRKPSEAQKKPNNKEQEAHVKTFNPENKVLVQIDKKTWVYRDVCNL